jgi:hypothetical protein
MVPSARSARPSRISATVTYIDPRLKSPQYQQFSLTIERELANRWVVRAGYSGPVIT